MTPIHFTTFIISLFLVDVWYTIQRSYTHAHPPPPPRGATGSLLPGWLRALVFYQDDLYGREGESGDGYGDGDDDGPRHSTRPRRRRPWHYHSNQKQIMRMEAEEAFRVRGTVLAALGIGVVLAVAGLWSASRYAYRFWVSMLA